ncbi:MAG: ABC transporter ATP-binding protein [Candidatus Njordarchaeota archaeon]
MPEISFVNVKKIYDGKEAVKNFNMKISSGEIFALLGPNGSGKTTLIRIATGLLKPTEGDVIINGYSIKKNPIKAKKSIGFVPDEPYVYESLSGYENIQFVADLWRVDLKSKEEELIRLAQILEMGRALEDVVSTYSAGMKRKLSFIMALIHDPEVLIIDEITASLDPKALASIELILSGLKKKGVAIMFSTHILEVAEVIADRIAIIHNGEKLWEGMSKDLRTSAEESKRLKDLFFELTGGPEYELIMEYLKLREKHG